MYGVPRFKHNFFTKYKKEILMSVGAIVAVVTIFKFVPNNEFNGGKDINNKVAMEKQLPIIGYNMSINNIDMGNVETEGEVKLILDKSYDKLIDKLGYDPEIKIKSEINPITRGTFIEDEVQLITDITDNLYDNLDEIKEPAYVMHIGEDFTIAVKTPEEAAEVLAKAENYFVEESDVKVDITRNKYNKMVYVPKLTLETEKIKTENVLATSVSSNVLATASKNKENSEENKQTKELVGVEFAENIGIVETYVNKKEILGIESAVEAITKENEKEKIYLVELGDSPYVIARNNDMTLKELYTINDGMSDHSVLHVDDEVVISVPEPELKVESKIKIIYNQAIDFGEEYTTDSDLYVGDNKVIREGESGQVKVIAMARELNGVEVSREIVNKEVLLSPVSKIIARGTKRYPVTGVTGSFCYPVSKFTITSNYGWRRRGFHRGVDLAAPLGTKIMAADGGTILDTGYKKGSYGKYIEVDHGDGCTTFYGHLSKITCKVGESVSKGEKIGEMGSTGNSTGSHLHIEVRFDGKTKNPLDYLE